MSEALPPFIASNDFVGPPFFDPVEMWTAAYGVYQVRIQPIVETVGGYVQDKYKAAADWSDAAYKDLYDKYRQYKRLTAIHEWSDKLHRLDGPMFPRAEKYLKEEFTDEDRRLIWQEVSGHYYFSGTVMYHPVAYRQMRETLGRCIARNAKHEGGETVRTFLPEDCVPLNDPRRSDARWLTALLSFHPQPIAPDWLGRHVKSLLSSAQVLFQSHPDEDIRIYEIEIPRMSFLDAYRLKVSFHDGLDLEEKTLEQILGWILSFNACLPGGHEVQSVSFERNPQITDKKGNRYTTSYYDPDDNSVHIRLSPVVLDSLTHEFGHALYRQWTRHGNKETKALLERLTRLHEDTKGMGALLLIKDAYYNVYNVNQDLLGRGHPEDDEDETAASMMSAGLRYAANYHQNIYGFETPLEHRVAGFQYWDWYQDWLSGICSPEALEAQEIAPWPGSPIKISVTNLKPKKIDIGPAEEIPLSLF